jgi:hypothetical protein
MTRLQISQCSAVEHRNSNSCFATIAIRATRENLVCSYAKLVLYIHETFVYFRMLDALLANVTLQTFLEK